MSVSVLWLIGGAALIALEAFGVPGVGFLFAGVAALFTGLLIEAGLLGADQLIAQLAVFLLTTVLLAVALWKRLKNWRLKPGAPRYHNMVGDEAVVAEPLTGDALGTVLWSGTRMQAKLASGTGVAPAGARVTISAVDGNVLHVTPK